MTIDETYRQAIAHHQAGRIPEAAALYNRILQERPNHADAMHHLGVVAHQRGDNERAVMLIRRAISLNSPDPACRSNLAIALRALGRMEEAVQALQEAVRLNPGYAGGHKNLAVILNQMGRHAEAGRHLRRVMELNPKDAGAAKHLGTRLYEEGRVQEAAELLNRALQAQPDDIEVLNALGLALRDLGRLDEALRHLQRAAELKPDSPETHNNVGTVLSYMRKLEEAAEAFRASLRARPGYLEALHNLGVALRDLGQVEEGERHLREALEKRPDDVETVNNLAVARQTQGDSDGAERYYEHALRLKPDHVWARFNRSTLLLAKGDFANGWIEYEWRLKRPAFMPRRYDCPYWDGNAAPGKTLLLYSEQGLGDAIQFVRYAAEAKKRVGRVILEVQEPLIPLLSHCKGVDRFITKGATPPPFDFHAPLLSLPGIFDRGCSAAPPEVPYVFPDPDLVALWKKRLDAYDGFKVGLNWQGNSGFQRDHHRSMPLRHFAPLATVPGVTLLSVQYGEGREQIAGAPPELRVPDLAAEFDDNRGAFMDSAAILANLDLLVTSDTAVANLAGALGIQAWIVLGISPDWRWMREGDTCAWYPTLRLFRQEKLREWDPVFARVAAELRTLADA